jgi:alkylation response protein AidB-like acyl-CoA dehydrogenase
VPGVSAPALSLAGALERVAEGAAARDAHPGFPDDALDALDAAGALAATVPGPTGGRPVSLAEEWALVRAVARADGSVGRIFDGHLNAFDPLAVVAEEPLRTGELAAVAQGRLRLGVWGADPGPGEGEPARVIVTSDGAALEGVKTFCSGAGGLHRALVLARGAGGGPPLLAYVDLGAGVEIDREWFRSAGMRASESHRVVFSGARVLAVLGGPGELSREPWFGLDAIRTAASWAGIADAAVDAALGALAARGEPDDLAALAAGRLRVHQATIDAWLHSAAAAVAADPDAPVLTRSVHLREAVAGACRAILDEAARACGSRPFATGGALDRARRDLEVFLLQHRLDPLVARAGRAALEERRP